MSIKIKKSNQELISTLKLRNLTIDVNAEKTLTQVNYFQLINGIENLLLPFDKQTTNGQKKFSSEKFSDFNRIYAFDRELSNTIMNIISVFEMKLKTAIAYHFTESHCNTINTTMEYTNKMNYRDISKIKNYPLTSYKGDSIRYQNSYICYSFNKFNLFKEDFLTKLVKNNDFIDKDFYSDSFYKPKNPGNVAIFNGKKECSNLNDQTVAVPLWVAIQTFDFGTLKMMCHYMKNKDFNRILNEFGLNIIDRDFFLNCLDIIHQLRNACAHFSLLFRFSTQNNVGFLTSVVTYFDFSPKKTAQPASKISLFDCLKVLSKFEDTSTIIKPLRKIIYQNNMKFRSKYYDLNNRLLTTMGQSSYKEWKDMLKKNDW